ncbi:MAG: hypothetical protein V2I46_06040 [Bacteroides sp.]|nr:hypothetical protein [Bacteroides sp.]
MKTPILFALALVWGTGILAQELAREDENDKTAKAVPTTIDFQGRLHDSGGSPVNATLDITFSLYDVLSGGTALWTETKSVQVADGLFQVKLGEVTPFTPSHFSGTDRWLGMKVGTEAEMSPRTKISSVGYALQALETDPSWEGNPNPTDAIGRTGNVGIGITAPLALLHTHGTGTDQGNVLFVGEYKSSGGIFPPVSGAGTRLMWYPDKAIFRLGMVNGTQWNSASMGHFSVAMGKNTTASGYGTVAFGDNTIASGSYASALGYGSTAEGSYAVAMGSLTDATGNNSVAMGSSATASGSSSFAMGSGTTASGDFATAFGYYSNAPSYCETVFGKYNTNYTPAGINSWEPSDRLFVVANGTEFNARSNALTILKNGNTGIGISNPANKLEVGGQVKITGGNPGAGKVLTSDPSGLASWQTPAGLTLPFSGSVSASQAAFQVENTSTDEETANIGIYGLSTSGVGVYGLLTGTSGRGIVGFSSATSGSGIAIYGHANAPGGFSGYFQGGRFFVEGNTGIGTQSPSALLHTHGTGIGGGNVVFVGQKKSMDFGDPPVSGAGTRMMWYPDRGAFRAGTVEGIQWDRPYIGANSVAMGYNTTAGAYSTAMGYHTNAGAYATAMGYVTDASGYMSTAIGVATTASARYSMALGRNTTALSFAETVLGSYNTAYSPTGEDSWEPGDRLFVVGNGTAHDELSNALTILKNGNTGLGTDNPAYKLEVIGNSRIQLAKTSGQWIALRTDGNILDFSFSGHPLAIQGMAEGEDIVMNPSRSNKVGIRTWVPMYDLDVNGNIRATGSVYYGGTAGSANGTAYTKPDYVFEESYDALDPFEVEEFLLKEKHLPWITSAEQEKQENGEVTDMTRMAFETVETVENLQLQIIEQNKSIIELKNKNEELIQRNSQLNARLERLERALESLEER